MFIARFVIRKIWRQLKIFFVFEIYGEKGAIIVEGLGGGYGDEKLKIPAGTQPGKIFHLKGKGVPHVRSKHHRGEQKVMVNVAIPAKLTKEQRELFEKLAESLGTTVKPQEKGFLDWLNDAFGG